MGCIEVTLVKLGRLGIGGMEGIGMVYVCMCVCKTS